MKAELVRIGNSRGIRIPKPLIEQCGLTDTVDLRVEEKCLIISSERQLRQGWSEAFRPADSKVHHELLMRDFPNKFDREEWQW